MNREESDKFIENMFKRGSWLGLPTSVYIGTQKVITDVDILELRNAIHNYKEQAKRDREENEQLSQELGKEKLFSKDLQDEVDMLSKTESGELFDANRNLKIMRKLCAKREEEINDLRKVNENNEVKARNELLAKENLEIIEKLRAVESMWQTRLQEQEKNATNRISKLEQDKERLYREISIVDTYVEDVKGQLSYAIAQRNEAEKDLRLMEEILEDKKGLIEWHINARNKHATKETKLRESNTLLKEQIEGLQEAIHGRDNYWGVL